LKIVRVELLALEIPLKRRFAHAAAERRVSRPIVVRLTDDEGRAGLGEIQPRPYVTGETHTEILETTGPALARRLLGLGIGGQGELLALAEAELDRAGRALALWGGFEGALRELWSQVESLDLERWIGPRRRSSAGKAMTLGLVDDPRELHRAATAARLAGVQVVKVKVGSDGDRDRLHRLDRLFGGEMPLRLDANGTLELEGALELLESCRPLPIASLEEPLRRDTPELERRLRELHAATGIPLVADESVVTLEDAQRHAREGGYQVFNLRVGKMGGLLGVARIARLAREAEMACVAGTMVGETAILNRASECLLEHSEELEYVEGLGQNRFLLERDPAILERVSNDAGDPTDVLEIDPELPQSWYVGHEIYE